MADTIDRQAAIDLCDWLEDSLMHEALERLPSAQLEHNPDDERKIADLHKMVNYLLSQLKQKWIPCSERLPEKPNMYTVTDSKGDVVRFVFYDTESSRKYWLRCAKAWMPLPEPYQGEGDE